MLNLPPAKNQIYQTKQRQPGHERMMLRAVGPKSLKMVQLWKSNTTITENKCSLELNRLEVLQDAPSCKQIPLHMPTSSPWYAQNPEARYGTWRGGVYRRAYKVAKDNKRWPCGDTKGVGATRMRALNWYDTRCQCWTMHRKGKPDCAHCVT